MKKRATPHITELQTIEHGHDWMGLANESNADSDRGAALLLGAFLEVHLEKLLRSVLVSTKSVVDPLFSYPGPLSTFSAKIRSAYGLRLVHDYEYRDLRRILDIRNRFAHELLGLSFDRDPIIAKLCQSLESRSRKGIDSTGIANRGVFWLTAYFLAADIDNRTLDPDTEERVPAQPVFELSSEEVTSNGSTKDYEPKRSPKSKRKSRRVRVRRA